MASQNGNPSMISGALQIKQGYSSFVLGEERPFNNPTRQKKIQQNLFLDNYFNKTIALEIAFLFI